MAPKVLKQFHTSIANLPDDCYHKPGLEAIVSDPRTAQVAVVAVERNGRPAAYIGYPDIQQVRPELRNSGNVLYNCSKIRTFDQVIKQGNKLTPQVAAQLFPGIQHFS